ncbi:MAG: site-specific integrase [Chitinophagaceae bacterium]|jgi:site-specific recombinase XerD|nr:site-specific integrase [Chitinophagaceae bacterium]
METRLSILFYGKKTKLNSEKTLSIYLRVTIEGQRFEVSTQRYVETSKWSVEAGKMKGNSGEARSLNQYLDNLKQKVYSYQKNIAQDGQIFSKETLRIKWYGLEQHTHTLVSVFTQHNDQLKSLIGKDNSKATYTKYRTTLDHTISFLQWKFKRSDIEISSINYSFITDFEFWLKSVQNCNHNTTIKYISNLRKIINLCLKNAWLNKDPFVGFKMTKKEVIREILTEEELQSLISKDIQNIRIRQVRDIFIFSCFTGLAYIDAKRLKRSEIVIGLDGERWIYTQRKKTDSPTRIPLLPVVQEIMEVYKDHPQCLNEDCLLPVPSNAKLNAYLKEVADICGINKYLTFHIARHTFATTVTLNNGVPIESVSKMLGHKSIKITQIYAKVLDRKLSEDMGLLREKFAAIDQKKNLKAAN